MAQDKELDELDENAGKGKGKLFLIIGIVVLLLVGGGVAAFLLLGGDDASDSEEATQEVVADVDEGEKIPHYHAIPKGKEPGMVISLPEGTGFKQAQISFQFFTYSAELVDYLVKNDPMIRHHVLNTLSLQDGQLFLSRAGREKLQAELKKTLADQLGKSKVEAEQKLADKLEAVYFTTFILQ